MVSNGIIGTGGFVAWFYAVIYNRIQNACNNIIIRIFVHLIGLIATIIGLYFLITTMPSFTSIGGMVLIFMGLVIFFIPFGSKK